MCQLKHLTDIFSNCLHIWPQLVYFLSELNIQCKLKEWAVYVISHFLSMQYSCIWSCSDYQETHGRNTHREAMNSPPLPLWQDHIQQMTKPSQPSNSLHIW